MKLATDVAGYFEILRKDGSRSAQYPLAKPTLTIGHATTCDIRLQIPGVQAQHCTIREASKQIFLTAADPHEPNAVSCTINDAPVTSEVRLSDGDVISIGGRRFAWKSNPEFIRFTKTSRKTVGAGATPKPSSGKKGTPKPVALLNATPTKPLLKTYVGSAKQASERRNVSFGPDLSPERFDLHLPPASPVKRGGRPNKTPSSLRKVVLSSKASRRSTPNGSTGKKSKSKSPRNTPSSSAAVHHDVTNGDDAPAPRQQLFRSSKEPENNGPVASGSGPAGGEEKTYNLLGDDSSDALFDKLVANSSGFSTPGSGNASRSSVGKLSSKRRSTKKNGVSEFGDDENTEPVILGYVAHRPSLTSPRRGKKAALKSGAKTTERPIGKSMIPVPKKLAGVINPKLHRLSGKVKSTSKSAAKRKSVATSNEPKSSAKKRVLGLATPDNQVPSGDVVLTPAVAAVSAGKRSSKKSLDLSSPAGTPSASIVVGAFPKQRTPGTGRKSTVAPTTNGVAGADRRRSVAGAGPSAPNSAKKSAGKRSKSMSDSDLFNTSLPTLMSSPEASLAAVAVAPEFTPRSPKKKLMAALSSKTSGSPPVIKSPEQLAPSPSAESAPTLPRVDTPRSPRKSTSARKTAAAETLIAITPSEVRMSGKKSAGRSAGKSTPAVDPTAFTPTVAKSAKKSATKSTPAGELMAFTPGTTQSVRKTPGLAEKSVKRLQRSSGKIRPAVKTPSANLIESAVNAGLVSVTPASVKKGKPAEKSATKSTPAGELMAFTPGSAQIVRKTPRSAEKSVKRLERSSVKQSPALKTPIVESALSADLVSVTPASIKMGKSAKKSPAVKTPSANLIESAVNAGLVSVTPASVKKGKSAKKSATKSTSAGGVIVFTPGSPRNAQKTPRSAVKSVKRLQQSSLKKSPAVKTPSADLIESAVTAGLVAVTPASAAGGKAGKKSVRSSATPGSGQARKSKTPAAGTPHKRPSAIMNQSPVASSTSTSSARKSNTIPTHQASLTPAAGPSKTPARKSSTPSIVSAKSSSRKSKTPAKAEETLIFSEGEAGPQVDDDEDDHDIRYSLAEPESTSNALESQEARSPKKKKSIVQEAEAEMDDDESDDDVRYSLPESTSNAVRGPSEGWEPARKSKTPAQVKTPAVEPKVDEQDDEEDDGHIKYTLTKVGRSRSIATTFIRTPSSAKPTRPRKTIAGFASPSNLDVSAMEEDEMNTTNEGVEKTTFDFDGVQTPNMSYSLLVSPMTAARSKARTGERLSRKMAESVEKRRKSMSTPRVKVAKKPTTMTGKTPVADYTNVTGVRRLLKTGSTPVPDYTKNLGGLKTMMKTPGKTPKPDYTRVSGVKKLLREPQRSPVADYTNVAGVGRLLKSPKPGTPKADYSTHVGGLKKLMKSRGTPKADYTKNLEGLKRTFQQGSPSADYTNVEGVKKMMKTPARPPRNDLSDVEGVSDLFSSPVPPQPKSVAKLAASGKAVSSSGKKRGRPAKVAEPQPASTPKVPTPGSRKRPSAGPVDVDAQTASAEKKPRASQGKPAEELVVEDVAQGTPAPKGRRARAKPAAETPAAATPSTKTRGKKQLPKTATPAESGRKRKSEEAAKEDVTPAPKRARRGKAVADTPKAEGTAEQESTKKPGGRRAAAKTSAAVETPATEKKKASARGRAKKKEDEQQVVTIEDSPKVVAPSPKQAPRRRAPAKKAVEEVAAAASPAPVKRGRGRAAKAVEPEPPVDVVESPAKKPAARGGRKKAVQFEEKQDVEEKVASPPKRGRARVARAKKESPSVKVAATVQEDVAVGRGARKRSPKKHFPIDESESHASSAPKTTRGRGRKKADEEIVEVPQSPVAAPARRGRGAKATVVEAVVEEAALAPKASRANRKKAAASPSGSPIKSPPRTRTRAARK